MEEMMVDEKEAEKKRIRKRRIRQRGRTLEVDTVI
jgi:hypothetical protein